MFCFVVSFMFVNCDNTPKPTPQNLNNETSDEVGVIEQEEQSQPKIAKPIETTNKNASEGVAAKSMNIEIEKVNKPSKPKKRPVLSFDNKTFSYGTIAQGDKVSHTFRFTNKGDSDLIIKNAEASCGCTTPSYPIIPIKPGEMGSISVTFNSTGKMGTQRPHVTVTSNSYPRVQTLYLEGFITDKLEQEKDINQTVIEEGLDISPADFTTKGVDKEIDNSETDNN